jgi:hypothetical protein
LSNWHAFSLFHDGAHMVALSHNRSPALPRDYDFGDLIFPRAKEDLTPLLSIFREDANIPRSRTNQLIVGVLLDGVSDRADGPAQSEQSQGALGRKIDSASQSDQSEIQRWVLAGKFAGSLSQLRRQAGGSSLARTLILPASTLREREQQSGPGISLGIEPMTETGQMGVQAKTLRQKLPETPRSSGFLEESLNLRREASMTPAFQGSQSARHYFIGRGLGGSDATRGKSRDVEFVIGAHD